MKKNNYLKKEYENLFDPDIKEIDKIILPKYSDLVELESNSILDKKVIGKDDVDIAAMIKKLDNSDWVKQGQKYHKKNDDFCPFCQQKTTQAFYDSLDAYFDETYLRYMDIIEQFV